MHNFPTFQLSVLFVVVSAATRERGITSPATRPAQQDTIRYNVTILSRYHVVEFISIFIS